MYVTVVARQISDIFATQCSCSLLSSYGFVR